MTTFIVPVHPEDLELQKEGRYCVSNVLDIPGLSGKEIEEILEGKPRVYSHNTWLMENL